MPKKYKERVCIRICMYQSYVRTVKRLSFLSFSVAIIVVVHYCMIDVLLHLLILKHIYRKLYEGKPIPKRNRTMHHHVTSLFYLYLIVDVITCIARSSSWSSSSIPTSVDAFSPALRLLNHNGHYDVTAGFYTTSNTVHRIIKQWQLRQYNYNHDDDENENENENNQDNINIKNELAWRTSKVRLEEEENKRFSKMLKSKPYKLPYKDAKQWVQRNLGASTQEEFEDLVLNGNLRTPYIPKDPQRYYTEIRGSPWLGWDDFLLV